jgi:hypothetical protein
LDAFDLDPILPAAGSVRTIGSLRDDTFQAHEARLPEHGIAILGQMLGIADCPRQAPCQRHEGLLALQERRRLQVKTIQVKQVEGVEHGLMSRLVAWPLAGTQGGLKGGETSDAVHLDDGFSVDQGQPRPQRLGGVPDGREAIGPVVTTARQDRDLAILDADLQAVAVPLDLVQPSIAGRYVGTQGRETRLDEGRQGLVEQLRAHSGAFGRLQSPAADGAVLGVGGSFDRAGSARWLGHKRLKA